MKNFSYSFISITKAVVFGGMRIGKGNAHLILEIKRVVLIQRIEGGWVNFLKHDCRKGL